MIIGIPKSLEEVPDLAEDTLEKMYVGMEDLMRAGQPMEIPVGIATGDLVTLMAMLKRRGLRIAELEAQLVPRIDFSALGNFPVGQDETQQADREVAATKEVPSGRKEA